MNDSSIPRPSSARQTLASPTQQRITQLDGLRALAILAVFLNHSVYPHLLWVGVDVFFVLSGFLITSILLDRKSRHRSYFSYFYIRRAFRILPAYYLSLALAAFVYTPAFLHYWPYLTFFGMNFMSVYHHDLLRLPLWSLAVEEQFYFVWPLAVLLFSERRLLRLCLLALALTPLLRIAATPFTHSSYTIYSLTPFRADLLCAGALFALLRRRNADKLVRWGRKLGMPGTILGFGLFTAAHIFPVMRLGENHWQANGFTYLLALLGAASLTLWALVDNGWLYRFLNWAPLRYLGQISYSFYLVHLPFLDLARRYSLRLPAIFAFLATLAYCTFTWFLIERPLIRLGTRMAPGGPAVPDIPLHAHKAAPAAIEGSA